MTTEKLNDLKALRHWVSEILLSIEGLDEALKKEELHNESELATIAENKYDILYTVIDRMAEEPLTKEQDIEQKWEADNGR